MSRLVEERDLKAKPDMGKGQRETGFLRERGTTGEEDLRWRGTLICKGGAETGDWRGV